MDQFCESIGASFPLSSKEAALFVSYLFRLGYKPSSVSTFVSAVSYVHKIENHPDPTATFLVKEALAGVRRLVPSGDDRSPISVTLLQEMLDALPLLQLGAYDTAAFRAMFSLAFFALLRVSEIAATNRAVAHLVTTRGVEWLQGGSSLKLTLYSFKHSHGARHSIILSSYPSSICPLRCLRAYLQLRIASPSQVLFIGVDNKPFSKDRFTAVIRAVLPFTSVDVKDRITTHSFRIGGATYAAAKGLSDAQLRHLGRWRSNAFLKYIRP